jgi:hypothetical protein
MVGSFDMPFVYAQDVQLENLSLIGFNNIKSNDSKANKGKTVHFFLDDNKFDEVWNVPERELARLEQYVQVLSPDFSIYSDMPQPLQIYNTFRNRWCASYWQFNKLVVIPTISWGGESTFEFCFDGIETGCTVAVSTIGTSRNQDEFMAGYVKMCEIIKPETVLNYGHVVEGMDDLASVITISYRHGSYVDDI